MAVPTYGQLLGELILQRRRVKGLTQVQLAEDAYGSASKTRRIVELETGQVARPHPKTIDPIIVTLGITQADLEDCAKRAGSAGDPALDRAYREASNLLEALARQFEHAQPNASLAELEDFLRTKASEWASLRDRIAAIDGAESEQSEVMASAARALAEGDFDEADRHLAAAEEKFQNVRTLKEVRRSADLRVARGDGCILKGAPEEALKHYLSAAEFFRPFDLAAMAEFINPLAYRVYETARRSLRATHFVAATLVELLLTLDPVQADERARTAAAYRLSLIYRSAYERNPDGEDEALNSAIHYATLAAEYPGSPEEILEVATAKIALANCLRDRGRRDQNAQDASRAIEIFRDLKKILDENEIWELRANASNGLGASLLSLSDIAGTRTPELREEALEAFYGAVEAAEMTSDPESWGAAKANIGNILGELASAEGVHPQVRKFYRVRAVAELASSLESYSLTAFPRRFAEVQGYTGYALWALATEFEGHLAEQYMLRSINAYEISLNIFNRDSDPARWAEGQLNIASILVRHSKMADSEIARYDLEQCMDRYGDALEVFQSLDNVSRADFCRNALEITAAELASLPASSSLEPEAQFS